MSTIEKATTLRDLHQAPEILRVVNVWDAITTKVVAGLPETRAIATAGHSIAASHGYPDGGMPLQIALDAVEIIVGATELPVSADLDDGYDNPAETIRRVIGIGVVGANVEDRLKPFDESVANVRAMVAAAEAEGVPFQLNARTDAIARGTGPLSERLPEAIKRGKAFLEEGASLVFIPGLMDRESVQQVVAELGRNTVSVIGLPGALTAAEYEELGIARISYGPLTQRVALLALQDLAKDLYGSGVIPGDLPALN
ncbi:2-methylisocitrate lyase-like PEP mutase family enzyme [Microbacteriaceae bacterium SG_E_30_P1]|uniref:2-methylisocitrate lyase-like PEP mutase family enzyme n=1 Tax=Antiquaquibacter oligotrophicus TaxID=2880260 RepID=A0ABT6KLQ9_9MICO|nr:isocitrate lyase/phosphoenolpyruvate mutase family protein [Antiquaquibacter oligotrophicus]MDH6180042.1 2-methylisocitrate lyase-like PEP mutase family enzyme [Antiquaquibacter oligotrophicus]UDF14204.1 isocitrate lyase/phosphoenolpyruvate mutase family protein [Antiquaquibacter oligotrophicus]